MEMSTPEEVTHEKIKLGFDFAKHIATLSSVGIMLMTTMAANRLVAITAENVSGFRIVIILFILAIVASFSSMCMYWTTHESQQILKIGPGLMLVSAAIAFLLAMMGLAAVCAGLYVVRGCPFDS